MISMTRRATYTSKSEREALAQAIKDILKSGPKTSSEVLEALCSGSTAFPSKHDLNRAIQILRRASEIHFGVAGRRWSLGDVHLCPQCQGRGWVSQD